MTVRPPRFAEWLLSQALSEFDREAAIGDMAEEFAAESSATARRRRADGTADRRGGRSRTDFDETQVTATDQAAPASREDS